MQEIKFRIKKPWTWGNRVYINVPPAVRDYVDENAQYDVILRRVIKEEETVSHDG